MNLTPVEVRHLTLRRGLFGYRRSDVHREIEEVADSFEAVWRERAELSERVHALETEVARHVELETLLRSTLVSAERAANIARERFKVGISDFLAVLDAERELLNARNQLAQSQTAAATSLVGVYKALAGGIDGEAPAQTAAR